MRHVTLTCINHPDLRWTCKEIAVNEIGQYNGARNIFFDGGIKKDHYPEGYASECKCSVKDLRFAPEEIERQKTQPLLTDY